MKKSTGKGMAIGGIATAIVSTIMAVLLTLFIIGAVGAMYEDMPNNMFQNPDGEGNIFENPDPSQDYYNEEYEDKGFQEM